MQRVLMQFFKPENYFTVREALIQAGRGDLFGGGCDALIPTQPPMEAIEARRAKANQVGDLYHTVANPAKAEKPSEHGAGPPKTGYRPGRKGARRQNRRPKHKAGDSGARP